MSNDHQAAILAYIADHPIIERRSDLTAAGIPPDLIGGLLDGLVACGRLLVVGDSYQVVQRTDAVSIIRGVEGVKWSQEKALRVLSKLRLDFPKVNLLEEVKKWAYYVDDHPLKAKSNVALQLHNWMQNSPKYDGGKNEGRATTTGRQSTSDDARERSTRQPLS